jgi:hypothetical protein
MRTKILLSMLLFCGFITTGFSQNNRGTSPELERVFNKIGVQYSFNSDLSCYIVTYNKLSSSAKFGVGCEVKDNMTFLTFITSFGSLKEETLPVYKTIREISINFLLGSLVLLGENNAVCWYNVMVGIDRAAVEYYFDYVLNNQQEVYNELRDYLKTE